MSSGAFSIVVPAGRLAKAMKYLRQWSAADGDDFEIVVVTPQDQPIDPSLTKVVWVRTERLFPPGDMRNRGVAAARHEYLVFCDDDVEVALTDIRKLVMRAQDETGSVAVGCRVCARYSFGAHCADYCLFSCYQGFAEECNVDLGSALLVIRRETFLAIGGFDVHLRACEDWDFCMKLRRHGGCTLFTPMVEAIHWHTRHRPGAILACSYRYGRLAGLTVQLRYRDLVSSRARLSASLRGPFFGVLKLVPQSAYFCLQIARRSLRQDPVLLWYLPMVFLSRASFLLGSLRSDERV